MVKDNLRIYNWIFFLFVLFLLVLLFLSLRHTPDRIVLLSFDVEPVDSPDQVLELLRIISDSNVSATFFITGEFAERNPDVVIKIVELGNEVACHSYSHKVLTKISRNNKLEEIVKCKQIIEGLINSSVVGFRAPYNRIGAASLGLLHDSGFVYDASIISGLGFLYSSPPNGLGEIPVSSFLGVPLEDVVWLHYLRLKFPFFYILSNRNTGFDSYLFHPHHIVRYSDEFIRFINYLNGENAIFISHRKLIESQYAG